MRELASELSHCRSPSQQQERMKIDPAFTNVGNLFKSRAMYYVPKYQRAYAWESDSIADFTNDLLKCFKKRKNGNP